MQKLINVMAVLSFVGTAGIVGGGTYLYVQKDAITAQLMGKVAAAATEAIAGALPSIVDGAMPELPKATGGAALPFGEGKGGGVPGMRLP
jgi:hypothetical protein